MFFTKSRVRTIVFVLGAIGTAYEAIANAEHVTIGSAIGVVCAVLFGLATKWPSDLTLGEAREREEKLKRAFPSSPP